MAFRCPQCLHHHSISLSDKEACPFHTSAFVWMTRETGIDCSEFKSKPVAPSWGALQADPGYMVRGRRDIEQKGIRRP